MDRTPIESLIARLDARRPLPPLTPEHAWHPAMDAEIASLASESALGLERLALSALLHVWNDSLDAAHRIVQAHEGESTCDLLHGIVHRREGDYSNAKYWFRRAGAHPAYGGLQAMSARSEGEEEREEAALGGALPEALRAMREQGEWNPYLFAEAVAMQESGRGNEAVRDELERLQQGELRVVLRYLLGRLRAER